MPILILALAYNGDEKIKAIWRGADEYIAWPQRMEEQLASARALIRRYIVLNHIKTFPTAPLIYKDLMVNSEFRQVYFKGVEVKISKSDFDAIHLLVMYPGRVYTFEQIYAYMYGNDVDWLAGNVTNAVRCQMKRIRNKMRTATQGYYEDYIESVRDFGYRIKNE